MTQEEKQLLIKDLISRLPYNMKVNYADKIYEVFGYSCNDLIIKLPFLSNLEAHPIETCKPYLRPMENMTEEDKEVYEYLCSTDEEYRQPFDSYHLVDWLIENHFDYRGLIPMGLALEAPEGMYN